MGVKSLLKRKRTTSHDEIQNKNKLAIQFFNNLMKSDNRISFKFNGFNELYSKLFYTGQYLYGDVYLEIDFHAKKRDVQFLIDDLIKEIDYTLSEFEKFYGTEVFFHNYELTYPTNNTTDFVKTIEVIANQELKVIQFTSDLASMVKSVKAFLSSECSSLEGVLGGRNLNFQVDEWNLVSFLSKNKGKRIRIELLDDNDDNE